jgi:hypothetical protein
MYIIMNRKQNSTRTAATYRSSHSDARFRVSAITLCALLAYLFMLPATAAAATGSISMGGTEVISSSQIGSDQSGTGWTWTAATSTLTLGTGYAGGSILFNTTDDVNLTLTDDVTINSGAAIAIIAYGGLVIDAGSHTLTLTANNNSGVIVVGGGSSGDLTVSGGTVIATNTGTGFPSYALTTSSGDIIVNGGTVTANGGTNGAGIFGTSITVNGGAVTATGQYSMLVATGISITGGTVSTTGMLQADNGNGNIDVSGGSLTATDSPFSGNLNVTGTGSVTATGNPTDHDVYGNLTVNGTGAFASVPAVHSSFTTTVTQGVAAVGGNVTTGGAVTLSDDLTVDAGKTHRQRRRNADRPKRRDARQQRRTCQ